MTSQSSESAIDHQQRDVLAGNGALRLQWDDLPQHVRDRLESDLGAPVAEAVNQPGGFSPGFASRLRLADGRRVFVKAVSAAQNRESPAIYRQEARHAAALPEGVPAPRLLSTFDDDDWAALVFEDIDGRPPVLPWRPDELGRVLDAVASLSALLTPPPFEAPPLAEALDRQFHGWRRLAGPNREDIARLDPWAQANLDRLADLEATWADGVRGDTLLHSDLRADNILLTPDRVYIVDWPWTRVGVAWFDLLTMLPSVAMQGGGDPEEIFASHPVSRAAQPEAVTAALAALTGYFLRSGLQPAPPGLPSLRPFQMGQGEAALAWLRRRTG
jgi:aminoglycoside phosphotransferase (APT) family kinase protein